MIMNVESIMQLIYADKLLTKLRKKIEAGQGTFKDTTDYCNRSAELLGRLFSENVLSMSDVERITANDTLLKDRYKDINDLLDKVQRTVDKKQGINIRPQHAPFNQERADQIGRALTDKTVSEETIQRRAGSAPATMTRAMQDDYVEENAKFRSDAGLKTYLVRVTDGDCCEWCTKVAGRYEYGTEPHDIYRRHDNCGCSVTYENGKQRQNVWTKKTWEVPAEDTGAPEPVRLTKVQAAAAGAPPPKVLSKEEAKKLEAEKLKENKIVLEPDKVHNSSIDIFSKTEYNLFRKEQNTGDFSILAEPMQMRHINSVLKELGIESDGIEFDIVRDRELIGKGVCGYTYPNGKKVQLYPDAFLSREVLVKTIGHERIHCNQIRLFGKAKTLEELKEYERAARFSEDYWWSIYKERTGYYEGK